MTRSICIHGHFYQPPRENPWLDTVEMQDSAAPFHDWNERITEECYAPNGASRILDSEERIVRIVNNYSRISFNFGPTLLTWLERHARETYDAILAADRESSSVFSGHGSAIAQSYNHLIMPLANQRDQRTQVVWGMRDFEARFGRKAEGMWLPETAVDIASLEALADAGVKYTILEPHQALRVRPSASTEWLDVSGRPVDSKQPYKTLLPSGRSLAIFFYDGPISRAVAFERLLTRGEFLANRLLGAFSDTTDAHQLVNIATDGETYGHHHRFGDMALAYALDTIQRVEPAQLTNYGEYLEEHPPSWEVDVAENTSWSCVHGVERWRSDCGCHTGGAEGWNQSWRHPLRNALDMLRDAVLPIFEERAAVLLDDPWRARDNYIEVILDRSDEALDRYFTREQKRALTEVERVEALQLLEMQRHAMLMYTSCGWFFNDVSGIETEQVLHFAGRVAQLAALFTSEPIEQRFIELLRLARSNVASQGDAATMYEARVKTTMLDLARVAAHWAVLSQFEQQERESSVYCYDVRREDVTTLESGRSRLTVGRIRVTSRITRAFETFDFGLLYLGDVHLTGGARISRGDEAFDELRKQMSDSPFGTDFTSVVRLLDQQFESLTFSIRSLFRDEQRRVLSKICDVTLGEAEIALRQLHEKYVPLMRYHHELGIPLPRVLGVAAEFDLNLRLQRAIQAEELPIAEIEGLWRQARSEDVTPDATSLFVLERRIDRMVDTVSHAPTNLEAMQKLLSAVLLVRRLTLNVDLWRAQNLFNRLRSATFEAQNQVDDADSKNWIAAYQELASALRFRM